MTLDFCGFHAEILTKPANAMLVCCEQLLRCTSFLTRCYGVANLWGLYIKAD